MAGIRIVTTRAPGLIPSLVEEVHRADAPVVLVPESFTLACETEIIRRSRDGGIIDLKILSPSSLVREIRELAGGGTGKPISGDGQNMIFSRVLHRCRDRLTYYRDSVAQPTLAAKVAAQIDDFTRARLTPEFLRSFDPPGRRTAAKVQDLALLWEEYRKALDRGFEDRVGQWASAVRLLRTSGLVRDRKLLIYGFDYITHDLLSLAAEASREGGAAETVIGLISDGTGPDREIFRAAGDSVRALAEYLNREGIPYALEQAESILPADPGIAYVEKTVYAMGSFAGQRVSQRNGEQIVIREAPAKARYDARTGLEQAPVPDLAHVKLYYARNSYVECQHACQTLIEWHRDGVPWEDMAVAVCEPETLPSLLPLTLRAAGIPFNAKQDQPILTDGYAQYFLSLLRILRQNFARADVIRMIKTGFTALTPEEGMDMENYARANGIHRNRWTQPFPLPENGPRREKVERLEELRAQLIGPVEELKAALSKRSCTGKQAAELLFRFVEDAGIYDRLLAREEELAAQGDDLGIDRNRQVWTAVNELLDTAATFIGDTHIPLKDLCAMLEASLAARKIKSLPQLSRAVTVAPPQMFFSSGIPRMIVMGLQENEVSGGTGILSELERGQLEAYIDAANAEYYGNREADTAEERPWSKIGQSLTDLAARQKQDIYQAVSLARDELVLSCAGAKSGGGAMTPSAAFTKLTRLLQATHPENVTGGLMNTDLRPFAPTFALETLAIRLRDTRSGGESFLDGKEADDLLWQDALGSLYQSEAWRTKVESILKGLRVRAPSAAITPDQAKRLYITHGMTISRVETFGSCPWRHLLQYGLDLFPADAYAFRRDEQGTFHHDVLKMFLDRAMKHPEWPDLCEETRIRILNAVLKERVRNWEGGVLTSDMLHRFQGAGIIRGVRTSVASMMRAFGQKPHFLPMAAEVPFGLPDETGRTRLPAIAIDTPDGDTVAFSGRIDRIDTLETEDGRKYFVIVDNKMSAKEVRQNSIAEGLQLQLPLYIRAAQNGLPGYEAAGGLYQPIRDVLVDGEDREKIRQKIDKELQTSGMILDSKSIQEAMKPTKIGQRKETNDMVSAVSPEEMNRIMDFAVKTAAERVGRIRSGEATPRPLKDGMESPCAWCDHPDACLFDSTLPGCRIREVDHKHREELGPE